MEKSEFSVGSRLCEKSNPRSHAVTTRAGSTHTHAPDVYNPDCGLEKTLTHPFEMSQTIDAVRFPPFTPDRRAIAFGIFDRIRPNSPELHIEHSPEAHPYLTRDSAFRSAARALQGLW